MSFEDTKMKTFNQYQKFDKSPSKTRVAEHIPQVFQCLQYHHLKT